MDVLSQLLWLKVRLVGRAWQSRTSSALAVFGVLLGAGMSAAMAGFVGLGTLQCGPELGRVLAGGILLGVYTGWVLGPAFGYRLNEAIDPTVLAHFPVRTSTLMTGLFLGNFLDPVVLVSAPLLLGVLAAGWMLGGNPLWGGLGALLFLFHAMGIAQLVHLWALALLRRRRASEVLFVVVALLLLGGLAAFEIGILQRSDSGQIRGVVELAQDWVWLDHLVTWTPAGLAMETMMPPGPGTVFGAPLACALLLGVAGISVWVAGRYTSRVLSGGGAGGEDRAAASGPRPDRLAAFFRALTGSQELAARASAECRLVIREPQYLLLYISYPIAYGSACYWAATATGVDDQARLALVGLVVLSSIYIFTGVVFNSLAVERSGLKLAFCGPQDTLTYLLGKNLGAWLLLSLAHLLVVVIACFGMEIPPLAVGAFLVGGQASIWVLLGLGNLGSSLAPVPLPVHGTSPRQGATFGRVFLVMLVNTLGMSLAGTAASVAWTLWFGVPAYLGSPGISLGAALLGLAWLGGVYAGSTWLGAALLRRRRDQLLEQIAR